MNEKTATFGAGCFWGVEARFLQVEGVLDATSGYMGGQMEQPTYRDVCSGQTGHAEVVRVLYDEHVVRLEQLMDEFFKLHNPTTKNRQGPDVGTQYRSVIFVENEEEERIARLAIEAQNQSGHWPGPVVTSVEPATAFWRAEEYHQRYLEKNGGGHCQI